MATRFGTPIQVGTAALVSLATTVGLHVVGLIQSPGGQFAGSGSTVGLNVVPSGASTGTAAVLQIRSVECSNTGGTQFVGNNTIYSYSDVHCSFAYPHDVNSSSGVLIQRIVYAQGNAPSPSLISFRRSTGSIYLGSAIGTMTGIAMETGGIVQFSGGLLLTEGNVINIIPRGGQLQRSLANHQARLTVWFSDTREGAQ